MNLNLFGNQVKLLNSTADITEWYDDFGAGKTFGALVKAASTQGVVLYVIPHASSQFFKHLPDFISDNFKMNFVNLSATNDLTKIFFVRLVHFDDNFRGRRPSLVVFDGCEPSDSQFGMLVNSQTKVIVVSSEKPWYYRETTFTQQTNHYLFKKVQNDTAKSWQDRAKP